MTALISLSSSTVNSCVISFFFARKERMQRKGFSTSFLLWALSQCCSPLAGDLQKPKKS